ncbi:hypothetical protein LI90_3142 [Carbonactinospora thermoautotrophica]|uniref:Endonuclease GajA/Old nuclease/RecF-like AAA domain-containing protein n=3 Tax=Carbonactinospora thermoautotrophica TaxID=1469144 RepID=A0A132MW89_9ACTN|nr:AAA family ATPase [Carbonactinospora thermoautotrophica]KWX02103.1 hypothetical protein LI90_3142 [Carbonactinospora thermoautotrophica]
MRILRIRLRNYRGVSEREVTFAENGVTVVEGGNEIGKTSLLEAFDLLLEFLDSSQHERVRAVRPTHADVGPEVEAEMVAGEYRFTYRKRWYKKPETVLTIVSPKHESVTGREAHQRVEEILAKTTDLNLWKALRIQQNQPLEQAALKDSATLGRALELAAGGAAADPSAEGQGVGLLQRARAEYEKYFTAKTGKPTGEYAQARRELEEAEAGLRRCAEELERIQRDIEEHARLEEELARIAAEREEHESRLGELEARWRDLEALRQQVQTLEEKARSARLEADAAKKAAEEREALAADVDRQEAELAGLRRRLEEQRAEAGRSHARADEARRACQSLRDQVKAIDELVARASGDVEYLRDRDDLARLQARRDGVAAALRGIEEAEGELATIRVDAGLLEELDAAHEEVVRAQAKLDAASTSLRVEALGPVGVEIDSTRHDLTGGETLERPVLGPTEITVPGAVRIRVTPGVGERDLRQALDRARERYRTLCERGGVADLAQARQELERRRDVEQRLAAHREKLARELGGLTVEQLQAEHARLTARVGEYERTRPAHPPLPVDLEAARQAAGQAQDRARELRAALAEAEETARRSEQAADQREMEVRLAGQRIHDAEQRLDEARERLRTARAKEPDEELAARADQAQVAAAEADEEWRAAADAFRDADPDTVQALLDNERELGKRLAARISACRQDRDKIAGRLEEAGGAHEALDEARTRHAAAQRNHDDVRRRAEAASLLLRTLTKHRDEAHRAYIGPFRAELERLGRIVFGPDLALEIGDNLQITHRTLNGITVPFNELSSGAREQLCLCARLACAALVDERDGVPVIIDDALGYSDPERLRRLGAVFNAVGRRSQVIVLTCTPERYRTIGSATVVPLRPSSAHPAPEPDLAPAVPPVPGDGRARPDDHAAEIILACLREARTPLGKSEILTRTGLDPDLWSAAIRALRDSGKIRQIGERRGAAYQAIS